MQRLLVRTTSVLSRGASTSAPSAPQANARVVAELLSRSAEETEQIGRDHATRLVSQSATGKWQPSLTLLRGGVGAGKSVFARGFIREALQSPTVRVQSPTYLLEQEYELPASGRFIRHFDLYRFDPQMTDVDARALEWHEALANDICLVEWPERIKDAQRLLPEKWFTVTISPSNDLDDEADDQNTRVIRIEENAKHMV